MKETNYWEQFCTSGKIEDYLQYRACEKPAHKEQYKNAERYRQTYAGSHTGDGDCVKGSHGQ